MTASTSSEPGRLPGHLEPLLAKMASLVTLSEGPHRQLTVRTPYTGDILGTIPAGQDADVETAVARARAAQPAWAARLIAERASCAFTTCCSAARTRCWT
jgi:acyl-CoA reductase-like NAD-dependent aldehyde dehydrogenase